MRSLKLLWSKTWWSGYVVLLSASYEHKLASLLLIQRGSNYQRGLFCARFAKEVHIDQFQS